jgi:prepilin-type processing-associated H-X9-DG protein
MTDPSAAKLYVLIEEQENSIDDGFFEISFHNGPGDGTWLALPADRHNQGCNLSFADGHVEFWRWLAPKKFSRTGQNVVNALDLRDLKRLQASCP